VLAPGAAPEELDTFEEVYIEAQTSSRDLLKLCDELVKLQARGFSVFLSETQKTLMAHQRLLELTSALILGMAGLSTLLVYRGMIAPLRRGLSESKTIIERQEKLASLGVLASGVAHEIRNPLTAIKFRLFSLKKAAPALGDNEDARMISDEINRLERIVKDFLRFARPSEPQLARVSGRQVLQEVHSFLKGQLALNGIQLRLDGREQAWVNADPQQLKQVLLNLVQNAAEAIGREGTITLRLGRKTAELHGRSSAAATLSVTDTGRGIPPAVEARLFDPFFTTKEGGTGLGLAIAARIVEKHGGMLRYETVLNRGTTFEVVLPRLEDDNTETAADRRRLEHRLGAAKGA
jgi:signal transduction histidine kinase